MKSERIWFISPEACASNATWTITWHTVLLGTLPEVVDGRPGRHLAQNLQRRRTTLACETSQHYAVSTGDGFKVTTADRTPLFRLTTQVWIRPTDRRSAASRDLAPRHWTSWTSRSCHDPDRHSLVTHAETVCSAARRTRYLHALVARATANWIAAASEHAVRT